MNILKAVMICYTVVILFSGCTYRHYLGMHGPSVNNLPEIHEGVREDQDCLGCHHPDQKPAGPPTTHPQFTGCLSCHNGDLK